MASTKELGESIDKLGETGMRIKAQRDAAVAALNEVRELIEGYVDVRDGDYGVPEPNDAMRAVQRIDEALAACQPAPETTITVDSGICPECHAQKCRHNYCPNCEVCQTCAEHTRTVSV
jgi:hypothetical protein